MLRRHPTPRYLSRAIGRLLTTQSAVGSPKSTGPTPTSTPTSPPTSTVTSRAREYTPGTVQPAQQWHKKENLNESGTSSGSASGSESESARNDHTSTTKASGMGRRPARGGQNLSARHVRLENAVRAKQARAEAQAVNVSGAAAATAAVASSGQALGAALEDGSGEAPGTVPVRMRMGKQAEMFRGLVVPEEPKPPADDECCMSGCAVCVYDLHEEELEAYASALDTFRASLVALGVPSAEWPARVRPTSAATAIPSALAVSSQGSVIIPPAQEKSRKSAVLSAFEEMERRLAEKRRVEHEARASAGSETGTGSGAGLDREAKQGVKAQAVTPPPTSPGEHNNHKSDGGNDTTVTQNRNVVMPHWRERQQLAAETQKAARRRTMWTELYEGVRWVLFSSR